jgi:hypothetical protein
MYTKIRFLCKLTLVFLFLQCAFSADQTPKRITIQANAKGTSTQLGQMVAVRIIIESLSTPEERQALIDGFNKNGNDGLRDALEKLSPKGRISPAHSVGNDVKFIRELPAEKGHRRFRLVTDRNVGMVELRNSTRSTDYNVGAIDVTITADGKDGSGTMLPACKLKLNKKTKELEIESYQNPWKLENFIVHFEK